MPPKNRRAKKRAAKRSPAKKRPSTQISAKIERRSRRHLWLFALLVFVCASFLAISFFSFTQSGDATIRPQSQPNTQLSAHLNSYLKSQKPKSSSGNGVGSSPQPEPKIEPIIEPLAKPQPEPKIEPPLAELKPEPKPPIEPKPEPKPQMPKLAIIIDDVSTHAHARAIKSLQMPITPSIFPPSAEHPSTPKIARDFAFYMVHLPLEAVNFKKEEPHTLHAGATTSAIESRLSTIKSQFKGVKYINNHTGSRFTSDEASMRRLLDVLSAKNILFVDSLTTPHSKTKQLAAQSGLKYVYRDIFIDNIKDENAIIAQLQKAAQIAQKSGRAIAIGHPYKETFNALAAAKNSVLKGVEVVYLKDIYELY